MSVLLVQLGDIHLQENDKNVLARADHIAGAIRSAISASVETVLILVTGDLAYRGTEEEFADAEALFVVVDRVLSSISNKINVEWAVLPGNHDCDFSGDQEARNTIVSTLGSGPTPGKSNLDITLAPLDGYFEYSKCQRFDGRRITRESPFAHTFTSTSSNLKLEVLLLNSAWISSIHEQPGTLHFPYSIIPDRPSDTDLRIAVIHHPFNWFHQPEAMRQLESRVKTFADIVITGHEHEAAARIENTLFNDSAEESKSCLLVSGGVLQETGQPKKSSFTSIEISPKNDSIRVCRFEYVKEKNRFFYRRTSVETDALQNDRRIVKRTAFKFTDEFARKLDDIGMTISHPSLDLNNHVVLDDVFMFPDLWELDSNHRGDDQRRVRSKNVTNFLDSKARVLITGSEKSGRTSLSKQILKHKATSGVACIMVNGQDLPKDTARLEDFIRKVVKNQYVSPTPDEFFQSDEWKTCVIIDDIHLAPLGKDDRRATIESIEHMFDQVVVCGDDLVKLDEVRGGNARDSGLWEYKHLLIVGFGQELRSDFVSQWLRIGANDKWQSEDHEVEVDRLCNVMNAVIRRQLIPSYPMFLVIVLQQAAAGNPSVEGGEFGHLFEGLATSILSQSQYNKLNIGDKYRLLATFAHHLYANGSMLLDKDAAARWHHDYFDSIEVHVNFDALLEDFQKLGILSEKDGCVKFRYTYFFCYFVAYFINQNIHTEESRLLVKKLCKRLDHRVSADIILFLSHLTGNPIVLDEMLANCDALFENDTPSTFGAEVAPLNRMAHRQIDLEIPDSPDENRREERVRKDNQLAERLSETQSFQEVVPPPIPSGDFQYVVDILAAHKTIQIVGQAIRNQAGSALKEEKERVLESVVGLSKRLLGFYFSMFTDETIDHMLLDIADAHKEATPGIASDVVLVAARSQLYGLMQFLSFSILKHTVGSVVSENLRPTIDRVFDSPANVADSLYSAAFKLEGRSSFPTDFIIEKHQNFKKNNDSLAAGVLRFLVAHHFYLYKTSRESRQQISAKLDIKFAPGVLDRSRKRLP